LTESNRISKSFYVVAAALALVVIAALIGGGIVVRNRRAAAEVTAPIDAEAEAVINADLLKILAAYDDSATIEEVEGPSLPRHWTGGKEIFTKYREIVRARKYSRYRHIPRDVRISGDIAAVVTDVDGRFKLWKGPFVPVHSERTEMWTLIRKDGQWKIIRYVYGQYVPEEQPSPWK